MTDDRKQSPERERGVKEKTQYDMRNTQYDMRAWRNWQTRQV